MSAIADYTIPSTTAPSGAYIWPSPSWPTHPYHVYPANYCPHCGRPYFNTLTWIASGTAPLTWDQPRVDRWALDQGADGTEALRPEEV